MRTLLPLPLSANESNWRLFMVRKADQAFLKFQQQVFKRDEYTCRFCGFRAKEGMEVVNLDGNFRNNPLSNLATVCPLCCQCFFLESIGKMPLSGGTLIYMPELSQTELNALCHTLFTPIALGLNAQTQARNIYRSLKLRAQAIEKSLGEGLSQPQLYGRLLIEMPTTQRKVIAEKTSPFLRLLPDLNRLLDGLLQWSQSAFMELKTQTTKN